MASGNIPLPVFGTGGLVCAMDAEATTCRFAIIEFAIKLRKYADRNLFAGEYFVG